MADGAEIKARIMSIAETKKVTDAMYMISSVKMRRAKREVDKTTPYFKALKAEIGELFLHIPETSNRYFKVPDPEIGAHMKHGILLVTSDKGLVGAYNQTAIGVCESYLSHHPETVLFIVGEYGRQYFRLIIDYVLVLLVRTFTLHIYGFIKLCKDIYFKDIEDVCGVPLYFSQEFDTKDDLKAGLRNGMMAYYRAFSNHDFYICFGHIDECEFADVLRELSSESEKIRQECFDDDDV